jgi:NADH-quinone oxidoreductase subunit G
VLRHLPGEQAQVVGKLVDALNGKRTRTKAVDAVADLVAGREGPVVVILGRPSVAESSDGTVHAASLLAAVPGVRFLSALRRANVHGALDLGLAPGFLPGRVTLDAGREHVAAAWGGVPDATGRNATEILRGAIDGSVKAIVLLGCDPLTDFPDRELVTTALNRIERLIVVGAFPDDAAAGADVLFPATVWGEQMGSGTNLEGRVVRLGRKVSAPGASMESWRVAAELAARLGADFDLETADEVQDEIARVAPAFAGVDSSLLRRARDGVVLPVSDHVDELSFGRGRLGAGVSWEPIPPAPELVEGEAAANGDGAPAPEPVADPASYPEPPVALHVWDGQAQAPPVEPADAYALRLVAGRTLYGSDRVVAESPSLAGLAPGARLLVNPRDHGRIGVDDGTRVRATARQRSVEIPMHADRSVPEGVAVIAFNQAGPGARDLIDVGAGVTVLRVETIS